MPPALSKGQVLMALSVSDGHRDRAAEAAGVSRATFFRAMRHHRVRARPAAAKLSAHQVSRVRDLVASGVSASAVAQAHDVSVRTVQRVCRWEQWGTVR